jgi:hypothetical protein
MAIKMLGRNSLIMSSDKEIQKRRFFRLPYPRTAQPPLRSDDGSSYKVLEVSEKGVILELCSGEPFKIGDAVCGEILFHDNQTEYIEGLVYRLDPRGAVVTLNNNISFRNIMREQSYISSHFPLFFRQKMVGKPKSENSSDDE